MYFVNREWTTTDVTQTFEKWSVKNGGCFNLKSLNCIVITNRSIGLNEFAKKDVWKYANSFIRTIKVKIIFDLNIFIKKKKNINLFIENVSIQKEF